MPLKANCFKLETLNELEVSLAAFNISTSSVMADIQSTYSRYVGVEDSPSTSVASTWVCCELSASASTQTKRPTSTADHGMMETVASAGSWIVPTPASKSPAPRGWVEKAGFKNPASKARPFGFATLFHS